MLRFSALLLVVALARAELDFDVDDFFEHLDAVPAPGFETCPPYVEAVRANMPIPVCGQQTNECLADTDCAMFLGAVQNEDNDDCSLSTPINTCFESLGIMIPSEAFYLAVDLGQCVLCCNDGGYFPSFFNLTEGENRREVSSDCICREIVPDPDDEDAEPMPCTIPFFFNDNWCLDCVAVDGVEMCGTQLVVTNASQLMPCIERNTEVEATSCMFADLRPMQTNATTSRPGGTEPSVGGAGTVAVSSLVFVVAAAGAALL